MDIIQLDKCIRAILVYIITLGLIKSNTLIDCLLEQFCLYKYKSRLVVQPHSIQNSSHPVRCHYTLHIQFTLQLLHKDDINKMMYNDK